MSDERLRELERRWRKSGSTDDEAAYLRQRVKVGHLSPESVELAAFLGHPAAPAAAGAFSVVLHLFFVDDTRERSIEEAAAELASWALGQRDVLAERTTGR